MIKKIPFILNIVLLAAVIALFILHFTSKQKKPSIEDLINVTTQISPDSASIAYVNYDSLLMAYDFYHELTDRLNKRKSELEAEFANRQRQYAVQLDDFNEKVSKGLVTRYQAQEMENNLLKEQENLINLRDQLTAQLMEEEQVMNRQLYFSIIEYLKEYNKNKGYQYILSSAFGGPVLYSHENLNITKEIIEGINNKYIKDKEKEKVK